MFVVPVATIGVAEPVVPVENAPGPPQPEVVKTRPQDDVIAATLAETKEEAPVARPKPPPLPKSPPTQEATVGMLGAVALLLFFLLGLFGTGAFAFVWVATHLSAPLPVSAAPPLHAGNDANRNVGEKKNDGLILRDKGNRPPVMPEQINFGPDGKGFVNDRMEMPAAWIDHDGWDKDGPYRLFKISLLEGKTYHFHVSGLGLCPRLQIFDNGKVNAERLGVRPSNRVMLAFQPKRTAEFLILVSTPQRVPGNFSLIVAPENRPLPGLLDPTVEQVCIDRHRLRVEDPLDPTMQTFGPFREYEVTLQAGKEYAFGVQSPHFIPVLRIFEDPITVVAPNFDGSYRPRKSGKHRVLVTSRDYGLGDYVLSIARQGERLQRILAGFDGEGNFTDRREMTDRDPNREGFGQYKEYRVMLEQGKKYRIEMSLNDSPTALRLFDPDNRQVGEKKGMEVALIHEADHTGAYRIHAASQGRGEYTFRISTEP
jgi:hypothetical protein